MDEWTRRAFVASLSVLPGDEPRFWLQSVQNILTALEKLVAVHAFRDKKLKIGEIRIAGH
jgi:hypothetical protein